LPEQVVFSGCGTHVQTVGEPEHVSLVAHAVQRLACSQPFWTSVGTHFWLQFFVPAGQLPMTHVVPWHASVPPPGLGHPAALHPLFEQPYVGSPTLTHFPPHTL
jgi:hypothetical protein